MKADFKVEVRMPFKSEPKRGKRRAEKPRKTDSPSRPPRIAVLMALAIRMEQLLQNGHVRDQAELAMMTGVSRARVTQVMGMLNLAPDIQEELLIQRRFGPEAPERKVRPLLLIADWGSQRRAWTNQSVDHDCG
jgi:hypothetical protein